MIAYNPLVRNNDVDEFITPHRLALAMAHLVPQKDGLDILDPCANTGVFGEVLSYPYIVPATLTGVELMVNVPHSNNYDDYIEGQDFLTWEPEDKWDVIIGNPPYSHPHKNIAEAFCWKALSLLEEGGLLIFLLRTNFANSKKRSRSGLFKNLYYHYWIDRPSFYNEDKREELNGTQRTNMHDYSVYVWKKGYNKTIHGGFIHWFYGDKPLVIETRDDRGTRAWHVKEYETT